MKETMKRIAAALLAAVLLVTTVPSQVTASEEQTGTPAPASSGVTLPENSGVRLVENAKADLTVSLPDNVTVTSDYSVSAYQVLRMVVPVDATFSKTTGEGDSAVTETETTAEPYSIENDGTELYYVTDAFKDFFKNAKNSYETAYGTDVVESDTTLYLTYNSTGYLQLSNTKPETGEDCIEITVAAGTKLDAAYFEADIVSRIAPKTASEGADASNASNARLFSDWLSRYVKAVNAAAAEGNEITPAATADITKAENETEATGKLDGLVYGYYLVMASDGTGTDGGDYICQSILNIPKTGSVQLKISPITIEKSVENSFDANKENNGEKDESGNNAYTGNPTALDIDSDGNYEKISASIGDRLKYTICTQFPDLTSFDLKAPGYTADLDKMKLENEASILTMKQQFTDEENKPTTKDTNKPRYVFYDTLTNQDLDQIQTKIIIAGENGASTTYEAVWFKDAEGKDQYYYFYGDTSTAGTDAYEAHQAVQSMTDKDTGKADGKLVCWVTNSIKKQKNYDKSNIIWLSDDDLEKLASYAFARMDDKGYDNDYSGVHKDFFSINFDLAKLKEHGDDNREVTITYLARLMNDAGNADSTNVAKVAYSNDPFEQSAYETISDTNNVYTYDLKLQKTFSDGRTDETLYAGITFTLYSDSGCEHPIKFIKPTQEADKNTKYDADADNDGLYTRADKSDTNIVTQLKLKTVSESGDTSPLGTLEMHGLGEGTYYLKETYAEDSAAKVAGYREANVVRIVITADKGAEGSTVIIDKDNTLKLTEALEGTSIVPDKASVITLDSVDYVPEPYSDNDENPTADGYGVSFTLLNQKGFTLPLTGELGNWMFAVIGVLLLAAGIAVIVAVNRKKRTEA